MTSVNPSVTSVSRKREAGPQKRLRPLALAQCEGLPKNQSQPHGQRAREPNQPPGPLQGLYQ